MQGPVKTTAYVHNVFEFNLICTVTGLHWDFKFGGGSGTM